MISFGLEAEQGEERNIPEKTYELPRAWRDQAQLCFLNAWCDQALLPQKWVCGNQKGSEQLIWTGGMNLGWE